VATDTTVGQAPAAGLANVGVSSGGLSPLQKVLYIIKGSLGRNLDPAAVISVAIQEGGFHGAIGDNGTSFGPFQLHVNGALPPSVASQGAAYSQRWANSTVGIDYALNQIQQVAAGHKGGDAIARIVYSFERPHDPGSESANAANVYPRVQGWISGGNFTAIAGGSSSTPGAVGSTTGTVVGGAAHTVATSVSSIGDAFTWLGNNWDRVLEVLGGTILLVIGLVLLTKQVAGKAQGSDLGQLTQAIKQSAQQRAKERQSREDIASYDEEQESRKQQKASDRATIRRNQRTPSRATGYTQETDDIPF
jgi:Sec-independent protein translocase protein TatA